MKKLIEYDVLELIDMDFKQILRHTKADMIDCIEAFAEDSATLYSHTIICESFKGKTKKQLDTILYGVLVEYHDASAAQFD